MKKIIIVTGSAGFIGYHVTTQLLKKGYHVIGIDNLNSYYDVSLKISRNTELEKNSAYTFFHTDITDAKALKSIIKGKPIHALIHLAAQAGVRYSLENPYTYEQANTLGTLTILEAVRTISSIKKIVVASSSSVYGTSPMPKSGFSETQVTLYPTSFYGATKIATEAIAHAYAHLYHIPTVALRFFTAYGPWGRPDMAYFSFTEKIAQGKTISLFNNGKMNRDFTYVADVVQAIIASLSYKQDRILDTFNVSYGKSLPVIQLIQAIEQTLGKKAKVEYKPLQQGEMINTFGNNHKARRLLAFHPTTNLSTGVSNFVIWWKAYAQKP